MSDNIQTGADLKGKTLSTLRGTFIPYLWDLYLEDNGLTSDDVNIIGQGGMDESLIALRGGEIDAVWVFGSANAEKFSSLEGVHVLTDMSKTRMRTGGALIVNGSLIANNAIGVQNLLLALDEASQFIKENPDRVADIMYERVKQPKEMTLADLEVSNWHLQFTEAAYHSLTDQKEYMVDEGIIEQDFDIEDKIDLSSLKAVLAERVTYEP